MKMQLKMLTSNLIAVNFDFDGSSSGLVEQINNFQTLSLKDLAVFNLDPFLSIHDDYFYHTQFPLRPQVSIDSFSQYPGSTY